MNSVTVSTDDVVDAFCRMLEPGIRKGALPREDCNKYGIDVLHNKKDPSLIMFHFVTMDLLEVNLELDMMELERRGKEYLDHLYGLLCDQTELARKERAEAEKIYTGSFSEKQDQQDESEKLAPKPLADAIDRVLH